MARPQSRFAVSAVVLAVFVAYWFLEKLLLLVPGYLELFERFEYYVPRSLLSVAEIALVLLAVCWLRRSGPLKGFRELGLTVPSALQMTTVTLAIVLTLVASRRGWIAPGISSRPSAIRS